MTVQDDITEAVRGGVDLYVHADPELMKRRLDDIELAKEMKEEGFRAAVHRHQFSATGERATLARNATGFDLRGAIALNGTVGGLNPTVVEHAIRMGAVYVSMPTLSGSAYQARISDYARDAATLAGLVEVLDEDGAVLPAVHEVLDVVKAHNVVFNLGYLKPVEYLAVLDAAVEHGIEKISATNPYSVVSLTVDQVDEMMKKAPAVYLEFACSSLRPKDGAPAVMGPTIADAIRKHGAERCVVTSDTGAGNDQTALQMYWHGYTTLIEQGIGLEDLRFMAVDHPARLIGVE